MYVFHIRPEEPGAFFEKQHLAGLFHERLRGYGSYVAEVAASLTPASDIVYGAIEPMSPPGVACPRALQVLAGRLSV